MSGPGGIGEEAFGDPMGSGGPISVLRARAVQSQVVRVAFSAQPINVSPAGQADALNPANYVLSVVSGAATTPQAVGVASALIIGPAAVINSGEYGADVYVDRAMIFGITYMVTAQNIMARFGGSLGAPFSANFNGAAKITIKNPPARQLELVDVASDPILGGFTVDDSGDLADQAGVDGLRKRMLRRAYTPVNAFSALPGYGTGLRLKKNFSPVQMAAYKADLEGQLKQEPEVADATVQVTQQFSGANAVITVIMTVRTKVGSIVTASTNLPTGGVSIP